MLVGQRIGPFEIEKELGSGAMGMVYRAKFHRDDGRVVPVALKVVALNLLGNEGAMARFEREASILKQLRHPHIVKLIATGRWRGTPFIAMEYIDGEPLDRVLARRGRLSWEEVVSYGRQLCDALQYAHEKGIIHRDLKPSNLMILKDGTLKLTDFGIAKDTDVTALTGANSTIGTAAYMSPEQCKGDRNLTPKSDLYSLGVVFFELLTGKKPFVADTTVEMFLKHVHEKPPRPGKMISEMPPKFDALLLQLMEKDKDHRPTDAAWVLRMLDEIEEDMYARKSAGLEAATARRVDRRKDPDAPAIDEADREAARALRGKRRRARKRDEPPWYYDPRVKAAVLVLALLGLGVGVYLGLRPPSPEALSAAIETAPTADARLEAAERYLRAYGDQGGEQMEKAAAAFREGQVHKRDGQLANRFARGLSRPTAEDDKEAYDTAWQAMERERAGDLRAAADLWNRVRARFPDEAKLPYTLDEAKLARARWGWVADKRLQDLREAEAQVVRLRQEVEVNRRYTPAAFDPTNPKSLAVRAAWLERVGDREKAGRVWDALLGLAEKDPDQRVWYLVASQHRALITKEAPDEAVSKRREIIRKHLSAADALAQRVKANLNQADAVTLRELCRDVFLLYDDETDPEIKSAVARARQILDEAEKPVPR
jgi:predicted Ser/Thr protein kinase